MTTETLLVRAMKLLRHSSIKIGYFIALAMAALGAEKQVADRAYDELRVKQYDAAITLFRQAIAETPGQIGLWKDLAYTLLKTGENEAARDAFGEAMKLQPSDTHVAMEYAFLAYETGRKPEARRIFDRIRKNTPDLQQQKTAEQAFQNIDQPLAEGIARWSQALAASPDNFSAHQELAQLAEERDELALAGEHFLAAWKLKPGYRGLLVSRGRVLRALGQTEQAMASLLAASRGAEPHSAEKARELLPKRYPFVYEFRQALELDPGNVELHREIAYLLLAMDQRAEAEKEFEIVATQTPDDLLSRAQLGFLLLERGARSQAMPHLNLVMEKEDGELADRVRMALKLPQTLRRRTERPLSQTALEAKQLAQTSYEKGFMKDALKYLKIANENDPVDFDVMLRLAWVNNILKDDAEAIKWFALARQSPDEKIVSEATKAFRNLSATESSNRTTFWTMPMFSSRWKNLFDYSQLKTEFKLGGLPVRPYFSARFIGDARGSGQTVPGVNPQYFSESSVIFGMGLATQVKHGLMGWFEAGTSVRYRNRNDVALAVSDYRGGLSFARSWRGPMRRSFLETYDDAVFISRFQNDGIFYSQNRIGYRVVESEETLGSQASLFWNFNLTADARRQSWANFFETGPGLRFRTTGMPASMSVTTSFLRGSYLLPGYPGGKPNFFDLRIGLWYAISH